jgi:outer membrane biosynthesis protein TonB
VHPVVEADRIEETDEHDSLGWTAFEEAQEPSDAMTIIGAPPREPKADAEPAPPEVERVVEAEPEPVPVPQTEPEPEPQEPDLPPAAAEPAPEVKERRRWWRRRENDDESVPPPADSPSPVHVLPGADASEPAASEEQTEDPLLVEEPGRRRFRRR